MTREVNFDGLIGPTHNYAGLSPGNVASATHAGQTAHPKSAALQGLSKMNALRAMGLTQCVLPPHPRPDIPFLRSIGFEGSDHDVLRASHDSDRTILAATWSASAMWAANAATVSPSADTKDRRVHITPANLASNLHRTLEPNFTTTTLRAIFDDDTHFAVHDPLPSQARFADEGAANHVRLAPSHDAPGVELFVFGTDAHDPSASSRRYPSRQTRAACESIIRTHQLDPDRTVITRQHPDAIDAGVFHNDVIATGNERVFLYHEQAFAAPRSLITDLAGPLGAPPICIEAKSTDFSLQDAVTSYIFNAQIITLPDQTMTLIAPLESQENPRVHDFIRRTIDADSNPVNAVRFIDVRESMNNGGGPACLRLRVVLTDEQLRAIHQGIVLTDDLSARLTNHIESTYPDDIAPSDLTDPDLAHQCLGATKGILDILGLPDPTDPAHQRAHISA